MVNIQAHYLHGQTVEIHTVEDIAAFIDLVSAKSTVNAVPSMIQLSRTEDTYRYQIIEAGIGTDSGFVRLHGTSDFRSTGNQDGSPELLLYDYMGNTTEIPESEVVPLPVVKSILIKYVDTDASIPKGFPGLLEDQ